MNYSDLKDGVSYKFSELKLPDVAKGTFVLPLTVYRRKPDHDMGGQIPRSRRVTAIGTLGVHTIALQ